MDTATELIESKHKRDQVGRKITGVAEREALMAAYEQSGLTQRAFAQREGINYCTLTSWLQGRRRAQRAGDSGSSAPVGFVQASLPPLLGGVEGTLPDGTKVRGGNAHEVVIL